MKREGRLLLRLSLVVAFALFPSPTHSQDDDGCATDTDCEDRPDGKTLCDISYPEFAYVGTLRCILLPAVPAEPEFGYFSVVLNRTYVRNFTKTNLTFLREGLDGVIPRFRVCTGAELIEAGCLQNSVTKCEYDRDSDSKQCYCVQNHYGNGVDRCEGCPAGVGHGIVKPWSVSCPGPLYCATERGQLRLQQRCVLNFVLMHQVQLLARALLLAHRLPDSLDIAP